MTEKNDRWKPLLNDAVDYEQTVKALLAFAAFIVHEGDSRRPGSQFGFGRRMTSSDRVVQSFSNIQYYDAPPPSLLILEQLWSNYFPSMLQAATYDEKLKATPILVSVKAAAEELQKAYGSGALFADARSVEFPRQQWIRNAFEQLVKHKLAMPPTGTTDEYVILYKPFRIDVRERFARLEAAAHPPSKPDEPKQMSIPLAFEKNKDSPG